MQTSKDIPTGCYLCGASRFLPRPGSVRDNPALRVYECTECGLVFLSRSDHISAGFYANSGMHSAAAEVPDPEAWLKESERDDERRFHFLKPGLTGKTLLDFGCGGGGFLARAGQYCAKGTGIEPETRLQSHFHSMGLEVYQDLETAKKHLSGDPSFDMITLFHVLEHLPDPRCSLKELSTMLNEKGSIIIEVPSANDALLALYHSDAFSHFTYWSCHLFLFTAHTLARLAEQAGLRVNYIKQVQRYPLSNHLHWLAKGLPGGHQKWHFLDSDELNAAYEQQLASMGFCDTIIGSFSRC